MILVSTMSNTIQVRIIRMFKFQRYQFYLGSRIFKSVSTSTFDYFTNLFVRFTILANYSLENMISSKKSVLSSGMDKDELYRMCRQKFLVNSMRIFLIVFFCIFSEKLIFIKFFMPTLNAQLVEFRDHNLLELKKQDNILKVCLKINKDTLTSIKEELNF